MVNKCLSNTRKKWKNLPVKYASNKLCFKILTPLKKRHESASQHNLFRESEKNFTFVLQKRANKCLSNTRKKWKITCKICLKQKNFVLNYKFGWKKKKRHGRGELMDIFRESDKILTIFFQKKWRIKCLSNTRKNEKNYL